MEKQIIIRLEAGKELNDTLKKNILKTAGLKDSHTNIKIEYYNPQSTEINTDYQERLTAMENAAQFLIAAKIADINDKITEEQKQKLHIKLNALKKQLRFVIKNAENTVVNADSPEKIYNAALHDIHELIKSYIYPNAELDTIAKKLDLAECYDLMTKPRPIICTLTSKSHLIMAKPLASFKTENDLKTAPKHLTGFEKILHAHAINEIEEKGYAFEDITLSSRHDTRAGVRNYRETRSYFIDDAFNLESLTQINNLSIIGSRSQKKDINSSIADYNFEKTVNDAVENFLDKNPSWDEKQPIPLLYLTLITPITLLKQDDYELFNLKLEAMKTYLEKHKAINVNDTKYTININDTKYTIDLHQANFAMNLGRHLIPTTQESINGKTCQTIIDIAQQKIKTLAENSLEKKRLEDAIKELSEALSLNFIERNRGPSYKRELYLASLLHIIGDQVGIVFGGCISAKDRAAIEMMHTDALLLTFKEYGEFPSFNVEATSEIRRYFVDQMTEIYLSGHHQKLSGLNATGVEALKTPEMYLPEDVSAKLIMHYKNKDQLKKEDRLASTNDCHKEIKKSYPRQHVSQITRASQAIINGETINLNDFQHFLICDIKNGEFPVALTGGVAVTFNSKNIRVPHTVYHMLSILQSREHEKDENCHTRLKALFESNHLPVSSSRKEETNTQYKQIKHTFNTTIFSPQNERRTAVDNAPESNNPYGSRPVSVY